MANAVAKTPEEVLADFRQSGRRAQQYAPSKSAKLAPVGAISDVATVTRGSHIKSGLPVLLVQDGSTQHALPLSAIGAAIAGSVITRDEINALLGA